jgi:hypothetical protein
MPPLLRYEPLYPPQMMTWVPVQVAECPERPLGAWAPWEIVRHVSVATS